MSDERVGTPQEFAALFGDRSAEPPAEVEQPKPEPEVQQPDAATIELRRLRAAAKAFGSFEEAERIAPRLRGTGEDELVAEAQELAQLMDNYRDHRPRPTSLDGGVRPEPMPPENPEAEHNTWLVDRIRELGGSGW